MARLMNLTENEINETIDDIFYELGGERKKFIAKVYGIALVFLAATWAQELPLILIEDIRQFFRENFFIFFIVLSVFLLMQLINALIFIFRRSIPSNIVLTLLTIEMLVVIMAAWCAIHNLTNVAISFGISTFGVFAITLLAMLCPMDTTRYTLLLAVIKGIFFLACFLLILIYCFNRIRSLLISFFSLIIIFNVALLSYKSQIIFGGGTLSLEPNEWIVGGFAIYTDFAVMFICILPLLGNEE